jgi:hypothetical protein
MSWHDYDLVRLRRYVSLCDWICRSCVFMLVGDTYMQVVKLQILVPVDRTSCTDKHDADAMESRS